MFLIFIALTSLSVPHAQAQDPPPADNSVPTAPATPSESEPTPAAQSPPLSPNDAPVANEPSHLVSPLEPLPDIEARNFPVKVVKRSKSMRTYLFDDMSESKTSPGRILLLRRESEPIMAFRVLKTYPEKKQFAAKRVRTYRDVNQLDVDEPYAALEKVSDIAPPPPTLEDKADLKELEANSPVGGTDPESQDPTKIGSAPDTQPYDPDLDAGTSPPPSGAADSEGSRERSRDEDEIDSHLGVIVDEVYPLDTDSHWLSAGLGFLRNVDSDGAPSFYIGAGARYALTLGKTLFLRRAHAQDSLAVEGGIYYYKIINFTAGKSDAYNVMPLMGTVRYNILFGENFGIFLYGGIVRNNATIASSGSEEARALLAQTYPAAGGGLLFRVGPSWFARVDLGFDTVGLGLILRF